MKHLLDSLREKLLSSHDEHGRAKAAKTRNAARAFLLGVKLSKQAEPAESQVLATLDGRTLYLRGDKSRALDLGDSPHHWSVTGAKTESERWNRDNPTKDHVWPIYWREFYVEQITRIQARSGA